MLCAPMEKWQELRPTGRPLWDCSYTCDLPFRSRLNSGSFRPILAPSCVKSAFIARINDFRGVLHVDKAQHNAAPHLRVIGAFSPNAVLVLSVRTRDGHIDDFTAATRPNGTNLKRRPFFNFRTLFNAQKRPLVDLDHLCNGVVVASHQRQ